jgi:hypothetical protein
MRRSSVLLFLGRLRLRHFTPAGELALLWNDVLISLFAFRLIPPRCIVVLLVSCNISAQT